MTDDMIPAQASYTDSCSQHSIVQKSYPLLSLWRSPLSLVELKILDTYLARIDSHRPEQRWVKLQKGELESLLGVTQIKPEDLKTRLRNLCIVVDIEDSAAPNGFRAISLFEQMLCDQSEDGLWSVEMQCTSAAMQYIFNIESIGYLKYRLRAILHLRSRYSYVLFLYIEHNKFRKTWEVSLCELREILRCSAGSYSEFRRFNDHVLKHSQKEIVEKTNCLFTYQPIRSGRKVNSIRFTYEGNLSIEDTQDDTPNVSEVALPTTNRRAEAIELLQGACIRDGVPEFSVSEIVQILEVLRMIPASCMPRHNTSGDILFSMYYYLSERYAAMNRVDSTGNIRNRFAYLISMLKQDAELNHC